MCNWTVIDKAAGCALQGGGLVCMPAMSHCPSRRGLAGATSSMAALLDSTAFLRLFGCCSASYPAFPCTAIDHRSPCCGPGTPPCSTMVCAPPAANEVLGVQEGVHSSAAWGDMIAQTELKCVHYCNRKGLACCNLELGLIYIGGTVATPSLCGRDTLLMFIHDTPCAMFQHHFCRPQSLTTWA